MTHMPARYGGLTASRCINGYMTSLRSIPALRTLGPAELAEWAGRSRPVRYPAGAVLRAAGERPRHVVLLLSGTVAAGHDGAGGVDTLPHRWAGPTIVDKAAVLSAEPPATGLTAMTAVSTRLLPCADFLRLMGEQPPVRDHVLAHLARDVLIGRRRLAQAATLPAVARVAVWLREQDPDRRVAWAGSQEQLARTLGLSRVTVNRALARLSRSGAVRLTAGGIVVADRTRLDAEIEETS
jgi:CRP/FNR family transcriptional regulator, cyclic AMP receptor protein